MDVIQDFLQHAREDEPIYITDVRRSFDREGVIPLILEVLGYDHGRRRYSLRLPDIRTVQEQAFVSSYIYAMIFNILSATGARQMDIYTDLANETVMEIIRSLDDVFQTDLPKILRSGYGKCLNVNERILETLDGEESRFFFVIHAIPDKDAGDCVNDKDSGDCPAVHMGNDSISGNTAAISEGRKQNFAEVPEKIRGKMFLGIDVGGTDIKMAVSIDGELRLWKEYDWDPASFTEAGQLTGPILDMTRMLLAAGNLLRMSRPEAVIRGAMKREATTEEMVRAAQTMEMLLEDIYAEQPDGGSENSCAEHPDGGRNNSCTEQSDGGRENSCAEQSDGGRENSCAGQPDGDRKKPALFDGIGLSFPDVVIGGRIVGGETTKTRGLRSNTSKDYEEQFRQVGDLCELLGKYMVPGRKVCCTNDGPMAAYTAAVEMAAGGGDVSDGFFAYSLGTELGTGWVTAEGRIPDIPLEIYNSVIDLGSLHAAMYPPDDVRTSRNSNSLIPGSLQKYAGQSGVFRLAQKYLPVYEPQVWEEVRAKGFVTCSVHADSVQESGQPSSFLYVPADKRKECLEFFMRKAADGDSYPWCREIFRTIGEYVAVTWAENEYILQTGISSRTLFGRLVKEPSCFELICEGARRRERHLQLHSADGNMAESVLMKQLAITPGVSVAQFAQAVGAIYFAAAGAEM